MVRNLCRRTGYGFVIYASPSVVIREAVCAPALEEPHENMDILTVPVWHGS